MYVCVLCNLAYGSHCYCIAAQLAFGRRRLPVVMVKLRMAQRVRDAVKFVEQGRILS